MTGALFWQLIICWSFRHVTSLQKYCGCHYDS